MLGTGLYSFCMSTSFAGRRRVDFNANKTMDIEEFLRLMLLISIYRFSCCYIRGKHSFFFWALKTRFCFFFESVSHSRQDSLLRGKFKPYNPGIFQADFGQEHNLRKGFVAHEGRQKTDLKYRDFFELGPIMTPWHGLC